MAVILAVMARTRWSAGLHPSGDPDHEDDHLVRNTGGPGRTLGGGSSSRGAVSGWDCRAYTRRASGMGGRASERHEPVSWFRRIRWQTWLTKMLSSSTWLLVAATQADDVSGPHWINCEAGHCDVRWVSRSSTTPCRASVRGGHRISSECAGSKMPLGTSESLVALAPDRLWMGLEQKDPRSSRQAWINRQCFGRPLTGFPMGSVRIWPLWSNREVYRHLRKE